MNNDDNDNNNPFAPRKPGDTGSKDPGEHSLDDLLPEDESDDYRFDYSEEDYDYDPDELIDDDESPDLSASWQESQRTPTSAPPGNHRDESDDDVSSSGLPSMSARDPGSPSDYRDEGDDEQDDSYYEDDDDSEEWDEDYEGEDEPGLFDSWPLGMLAIAAVAIILLAVGGFGVMQERAAMQERIRALQSQLAVAVDPEQLAVERGSQRELVERNSELEATIQELQLENRQLSDTVGGLEQQLEVQQSAASQAKTSTPSAAPPPPRKTPAKPEAAASSAVSGDWFVNFGSYREKSHAQSWAEKLKPAAGKVVVAAAPGGDLFRVRVVALPDKKTAKQIASTLQSQYGLSELWVGEQ